MAQGFTTLRNSNLSSNSSGSNQNCYYCTVAALAGITTGELINYTGIAEQNTATAPEILGLMQTAGVAAPTTTTFNNEASLSQALNTLANNEAVGLAFSRHDGTGHMIVAAKNGVGVCAYIDYQKNPPTISQAFPEPLANIREAHVFHRA